MSNINKALFVTYFFNNLVYKNAQAEIRRKFKNILGTLQDGVEVLLGEQWVTNNQNPLNKLFVYPYNESNRPINSSLMYL